MKIPSRTPEGSPQQCPVCGEAVCLEASPDSLDAPCPHCGQLLWFTDVLISVVEYPVNVVKDSAEEEAFIQELTDVVAKSQQPKLLLDLSGVQRFTRAILAALLSLERQCRRRNGIIVLCRANPEIQQFFRVNRLDEIFLMAESREESLKYLSTSDKEIYEALRAVSRKLRPYGEHDVVLDAWASFIEAFKAPDCRDEFWQLLLAAHRQKIYRSRGESLTPPLSDTVEQALMQLDPDLRKHALARLEGHTKQEIAERFGLVSRSVERKLDLIRLIWANNPGGFSQFSAVE